MIEVTNHVGALLEDIQTSIKAIGEQQGAMLAAQRAMHVRFDRIETTVERIDVRVGALEVFAADTQKRLTGLEAFAADTQKRLTGLEASATDTQKRLGRIEGHLQLNGSHARKTTRAAPTKRGKKR